MTKKYGFSLAEILVTLGIIAIVAAMTIPVLLNAATSDAFKSSYKKSISSLNQAIQTNTALNANADFSSLSAGDFAVDGTIANMFAERLRVFATKDAEVPELEVAATVKASSASNYTIFFNDGATFSFPKAAQYCDERTWQSYNCKGILDVNGMKQPNKLSNCSTNSATSDKGICTKSKLNVNDRFSVRFLNNHVVPNGDASRFVFYN